MKLIFEKTNLMNAIRTVSKAIASKTNMQILECIHIDALEGVIKMTGNDLDLGIETVVSGIIEEPGETVINARIFSDIVSKLPESSIEIVTDDKKAYITCEQAKFEIITMDAVDYTDIPSIDKENGITVSELTLKDIIRHTIFAINEAETNKLLTGELFEVTGSRLKVVALDKFRIAIRYVELKEDYGNHKILIPGKSLNEIGKILTGEADDNVEIFFTENHVMFEFGNTRVVSRLIDCKNFFDTDRMISNDYKTKVVANKNDLTGSIDRATLLIKEGEKKPLFFTIKDDELELSINTFIGSMNESLSIEKEGENMTIGFNPKYFIDVFKTLDDEEVSIYLKSPNMPCFVKDDEGSYIYIILPVVQ